MLVAVDEGRLIRHYADLVNALIARRHALGLSQTRRRRRRNWKVGAGEHERRRSALFGRVRNPRGGSRRSTTGQRRFAEALSGRADRALDGCGDCEEARFVHAGGAELHDLPAGRLDQDRQAG